MPITKPLIVAVAALAIVCAFFASVAPAQAASKLQVLHKFRGKDGQSPSAGVIFDAAGNLYGTTTWGGHSEACGSSGCGTVFQLSPNTNGKWTERVLHSFDNADGSDPYAGVVFDGAGNLYGPTSELGYGWGNVFKLALCANGKWSETVLHSFDVTDGQYPWKGVVLDAAGNVYGTTYEGGNFKSKECLRYGCGVVFKLAPGAGGKWSHTTIHAFDGRDGDISLGDLTLDAAGNLYGTTAGGGAKGLGTVFKLTPGTDGKWTETVLHSFGQGEGNGPNAGVIFDRAGNLYGTTYGDGNSGNVFELIPGAKGKWTLRVLHVFGGRDGANLDGGVIFDAAGNLYGTAVLGGESNQGVVFKLTPHANGSWTEKVLHSFNGKDGAEPSGNLVFDAVGSLYGTTFLGGNFSECTNTSGCGVVFKITPELDSGPWLH